MRVHIIVYNCRTQQHTTVPIIFPLIHQAIIIAQMLSTGCEGLKYGKLTETVPFALNFRDIYPTVPNFYRPIFFFGDLPGFQTNGHPVTHKAPTKSGQRHTAGTVKIWKYRDRPVTDTFAFTNKHIVTSQTLVKVNNDVLLTNSSLIFYSLEVLSDIFDAKEYRATSQANYGVHPQISRF